MAGNSSNCYLVQLLVGLLLELEVRAGSTSHGGEHLDTVAALDGLVAAMCVGPGLLCNHDPQLGANGLGEGGLVGVRHDGEEVIHFLSDWLAILVLKTEVVSQTCLPCV